MRLQTILAAGLVAIATASPVAAPDNVQRAEDKVSVPTLQHNVLNGADNKKREPQRPYGHYGFAIAEDTKDKREPAPQQNYGGKKFFRDAKREPEPQENYGGKKFFRDAKREPEPQENYGGKKFFRDAKREPEPQQNYGGKKFFRDAKREPEPQENYGGKKFFRD